MMIKYTIYTKMINKRTIDIFDIKHDKKTIIYVYKGSNLVWQAIKSCFGLGYWINNAPWINTDGWKNN